jgi:hypothetical protein
MLVYPTIQYHLKNLFMAKYFIEIPHSSEKLACLRSVSVLLSSGSHFLTNADWGCYDDNHKAWFFMDAESKEEALMVVPPAYRKDTIITRINKFKLAEVNEMLKHHTE